MVRMRPAVKAGLRSLIGVDSLFMRQLLGLSNTPPKDSLFMRVFWHNADSAES